MNDTKMNILQHVSESNTHVNMTKLILEVNTDKQVFERHRERWRVDLIEAVTGCVWKQLCLFQNVFLKMKCECDFSLFVTDHYTTQW